MGHWVIKILDADLCVLYKGEIRETNFLLQTIDMGTALINDAQKSVLIVV